MAGIGACDLNTSQSALTFTVSITVALPGSAWTAITAIIQVANGMGATYIRACDLNTAQSALTLAVRVTIPFASATGPAIRVTAII